MIDNSTTNTNVAAVGALATEAPVTGAVVANTNGLESESRSASETTTDVSAADSAAAAAAAAAAAVVAVAVAWRS